MEETQRILKINNFRNYLFLLRFYELPEWFDHQDIDWIRYYGSKNFNTLNNEQQIIFDIFRNYLSVRNDFIPRTDLTSDEMKQLLNIKICDFDWWFMWSNPVFDSESEEFIIQKHYIGLYSLIRVEKCCQL